MLKVRQLQRIRDCVLHFAIERIGIQEAIRKTIADAFIEAVAEENELRRIVDRKRFEHHRVHQAEDGGVGADAESKRKQGNEGDSGTAKHGAHAVVDVTKEVFEPLPPPCGVTLLAQDGWIAKAATCGGAGFGVCGGHAGRELLLLAKLQVQAHFLLEVGVKLPAMEEHVEACCEFAQPIHSNESFQTASITRATAPMTRSNWESSTATCFRPAAVS